MLANARRQYMAGLSDFLNVLTVQQNLLGTQQALSLSEADVSVSLISLFKALGGGWETVFPATDSKGDQATTGTEAHSKRPAAPARS